METAFKIYNGEFNPDFFRYPAGHMNMLALIYKTCSLFANQITMESAYKIAWYLSNVFMALIPVMVFSICTLLGTYVIGLIGCCLVMTSDILLQHSQYAIVDVSLSFFCSLFFTFSIYWFMKSNFSPNKIFFLSSITGIAISMKYTGLLLVLSLFVIIYHFIEKNPKRKGGKHFQLIFIGFTGVALLLIISVLLTNKNYFIQILIGLTTDGILEVEYYQLLNKLIILTLALSLGLLVLTYFIQVKSINGLGTFISPFYLKSFFLTMISFFIFSPFTIIEIKKSFADFMYEYRHMQIGSAAQYHYLSDTYHSIVQSIDRMYPIRFYQKIITSNFGIAGVIMAIIGVYEIMDQRKLVGTTILSFCLLMILTISGWQNVAVRYTLSIIPIIYVLIPLGIHRLSTFLDKKYLQYNYSLALMSCLTGFEPILRWIKLFG